MVEDKGRIRLLPPEEARKIAAGEVIDRPAALVRECMANAIDAGSTLIQVHIEGGGSRRTEVIDDGNGMDRGDLELCWKTHATSKIRSMEDLNIAETLGFRGEALAAAAAISHLEILTSADGREAWRLEVGPSGDMEPQIEQSRRTRGTSVRALDIFDTIPVRKRFLKRDWSEANLCRVAFTDKALAFPGIGFRFIQDGKLKIFLPPVSTRRERFAALLLSRNEGSFLHEINASGTGFSVTIVLGGPELSRNDRRQQYVFANGRRIQEFSLLQALEYGVQGWFPNNAHPIGALYVDINPALADFNIHPAKREVRFADLGAIHHAVTQSIRDFIHHRNLAVGRQIYEFDEDERFQNSLSFQREEYPRTESGVVPTENIQWSGGWRPPSPGPDTGYGNRFWERNDEVSKSITLAEEALENPQDFFQPASKGCSSSSRATEKDSPYGLKYAGRVFDLFILVEKDNRLFIIDQHAAHERILYEDFLSKPIPRQELLVAIPFTTESEEDDRFLETRREALAKLGLIITSDNGSWRIEALPASWHLGDAETVKEILNLKNTGENIAEHWAATLACHSAVKDGEYLDETTALKLAFTALNLPIPRCPHGRPLWFEICREELFRAVKRV
jgi:DNA mismatch repair protein MutL